MIKLDPASMQAVQIHQTKMKGISCAGCASLFLALLIGCGSARPNGMNFVWNTSTGNWRLATNWTPNGVPGVTAGFGDSALIGTGGTTGANVTYDVGQQNLGNLVLNA